MPMLPLRVLLLENLEILGKSRKICTEEKPNVFVDIHSLPGVRIPICNFIPALELEISMVLMLFPMCVLEPKPK